MKIFQTTLVKKIPLIWRQAIAQNTHRGLTIKSFIMQFLLSRNPFRNHSVFMTDYLIVGANPILNLIKLKSLLKSIENSDDTSDKKISLITTNSFDYWGYHAFEKDDVWKMFSHNYSMQYQNIEDFFQSEISQLIIPEHVDIVFINDFNFSIYSIQKDNYVDGFILHLTDTFEQKLDIFSHMKSVFKAENNIRLKYYHFFKSFFHKKQTVLDNIGEISFSEKKMFSKDSNIQSHLICAKEIFISSLTHLFNNSSHQLEQYIMGEDIDVTIFEHSLIEHCFGSAQHIANCFVGVESLAIDDFLNMQL